MKGKGILFSFFAVDLILAVCSVYLYLGLDRKAPVISFSEDEILYEEDMDEAALLKGVSAYDEEEGDVTASLLVEKVANTAEGKVIVTYAALDVSNNVAKRSRIYEMK